MIAVAIHWTIPTGKFAIGVVIATEEDFTLAGLLLDQRTAPVVFGTPDAEKVGLTFLQSG